MHTRTDEDHFYIALPPLPASDDKYPLDVIQCVRSSYCVDNSFIIILFPKRNSIFKRNYAKIFDVSYGRFSNDISNIISLVIWRKSHRDQWPGKYISLHGTLMESYV